MTEVKEIIIINEAARKKFFNISNIKKQIATRQLNFVGKVACNLTTNFPTNFLPRGVTKRDNIEVNCTQTRSSLYTTST